MIIFHLKGLSLSGGGAKEFFDLEGIPNILRVVPESTTYSGVILQWANGATASSQYSTGNFSAREDFIMLIGSDSFSSEGVIFDSSSTSLNRL
jgi:hypothetical protein